MAEAGSKQKKKVSMIAREYYNILFSQFFRLICLLYRKDHGFSDNEIVIGFSSAWHGGNIKGIIDAFVKEKELIKKHNICIYFTSPNKEQVAYAKSQGITAYWWHDLAAISIFSKTKVFVCSHGESYIPVSRRISIKDFFLDVIGEFGRKLSFKRTDFTGKGFAVKRFELWHGIPFKDVYIDKIPIPPDIFVVSSEFMKKSYSAKGYDLNIFKITGLPRNDILFKKIDKKMIFSKLDIPMGKKIVLYAPTWGHYTNMGLFPWNDWKDTLLLLDKFADENGNVHFIIRTHKYWEGTESSQVDEVLQKCKNISWVSMDVFPDTYSLLNLTNILITDWSSIAFDFMLKKCPIIFIDRPNPYKKFCFTPEERAGAVVKTYDELEKTIGDSLKNPSKFIKKYAPNFYSVLDKAFLYKDRKASERCIKELVKLLKN